MLGHLPGVLIASRRQELHLHFTDEETEAKISTGLVPIHTAGKWQSQDSNPSLSDSKIPTFAGQGCFANHPNKPLSTNPIERQGGQRGRRPHSREHGPGGGDVRKGGPEVGCGLMGE